MVRIGIQQKIRSQDLVGCKSKESRVRPQSAPVLSEDGEVAGVSTSLVRTSSRPCLEARVVSVTDVCERRSSRGEEGRG